MHGRPFNGGPSIRDRRRRRVMGCFECNRLVILDEERRRRSVVEVWSCAQQHRTAQRRTSCPIIAKRATTGK